MGLYICHVSLFTLLGENRKELERFLCQKQDDVIR